MLMVNVWPFLIIAILVAPATPSHKQDHVDKQNSNAPKKTRSKFNFRLHDVSQDVFKKAVRSGRFTQMLLTRPETEQILGKTMASKFIREMVKGTLPHEQYRAFLMQDAHYLYTGRNILQETRDRITKKYPEFADMYNIQAGKYDKAYQDLLKELNLPNVDDVTLSPATDGYEQFLFRLSQDHPRRLAIGFLPCSQSFRSISGELMPQVQGEYREWFESNLRPAGYESELEKFINSKAEEGIFTKEDFPIYLEGMGNEENFIKKAVAGL